MKALEEKIAKLILTYRRGTTEYKDGKIERSNPTGAWPTVVELGRKEMAELQSLSNSEEIGGHSLTIVPVDAESHLEVN